VARRGSKSRPRDPDAPRDKLESTTRFACGAIVGSLVSTWLLFRLINRSPEFIVVVPLIAVACGLAAMRFGDRFWYKFSDWWY
jgi:hypothetical protein